MKNWEILDCLKTSESTDKNENLLLSDLLRGCDLDIKLDSMNFEQKLEEIKNLIDESNQSKAELISSFPSCSLAVIRHHSRDSGLENSMEIDRMSLSSSEVYSSNDSPIFDSRLSIDRHNRAAESPESMNISDLL